MALMTQPTRDVEVSSLKAITNLLASKKENFLIWIQISIFEGPARDNKFIADTIKVLSYLSEW